ncbi:MAG: hypothetical protein MR902_03335 [Campylobacter sp.]|nr:hypothetical protein [Campylobacter sp.]
MILPLRVYLKGLIVIFGKYNHKNGDENGGIYSLGMYWSNFPTTANPNVIAPLRLSKEASCILLSRLTNFAIMNNNQTLLEKVVQIAKKLNL